ncbi:MAG: hypothetical protein HY704_05695 [Gemmatimonadetes bacterium]|nr:hypothetical protein [Gemmatimonadota bacterium]
MAPSPNGQEESVTFSRVALVDSISEQIYKGLTKPAALPPQLQCMQRPKISAREEADYTIRFAPSCFGTIVTEFHFSFRVNPPRERLKLKDGRLVVVKRGPKVQVLVYGPGKKAAATAARHAKMFSQLYKIEGARAKELAKNKPASSKNEPASSKNKPASSKK